MTAVTASGVADRPEDCSKLLLQWLRSSFCRVLFLSQWQQGNRTQQIEDVIGSPPRWPAHSRQPGIRCILYQMVGPHHTDSCHFHFPQNHTNITGGCKETKQKKMNHVDCEANHPHGQSNLRSAMTCNCGTLCSLFSSFFITTQYPSVSSAPRLLTIRSATTSMWPSIYAQNKRWKDNSNNRLFSAFEFHWFCIKCKNPEEWNELRQVETVVGRDNSPICHPARQQLLDHSITAVQGGGPLATSDALICHPPPGWPHLWDVTLATGRWGCSHRLSNFAVG